MTAQSPQPEQACDRGAVVIGGSAGSLDPLLDILERLPVDFELPVVVVIHTANGPSSHLVDALRFRCSLPLREPFDKEPLARGTVFIAPAGYHLMVGSGPSFAYSIDPPENFSQPSINVLFESAVEIYGAQLVAVILSGANSDGARGLAAVCEAGGLAIVQAPEQATSPAMPRAALAACPRATVLPSTRIGDRLAAAARRIG